MSLPPEQETHLITCCYERTPPPFTQFNLFPQEEETHHNARPVSWLGGISGLSLLTCVDAVVAATPGGGREAIRGLVSEDPGLQWHPEHSLGWECFRAWSASLPGEGWWGCSPPLAAWRGVRPRCSLGYPAALGEVQLSGSG